MHSIPQRIRTEITHVRFGPVEIKQKSYFTNAHNKKKKKNLCLILWNVMPGIQSAYKLELKVQDMQ